MGGSILFPQYPLETAPLSEKSPFPEGEEGEAILPCVNNKNSLNQQFVFCLYSLFFLSLPPKLSLSEGKGCGKRGAVLPLAPVLTSSPFYLTYRTCLMAVRGGGMGRGNLKIDHRRLDSAFKVTENETVKYLAFQGKIFEKAHLN